MCFAVPLKFECLSLKRTSSFCVFLNHCTVLSSSFTTDLLFCRELLETLVKELIYKEVHRATIQNPFLMYAHSL